MSIEFAKEICAMSQTIKGKQLRLYLFECERIVVSQIPKLPQTYKEALIELVAAIEEKEKLQLELQEAQPKVEFFNQVTDSKDAIDIGEAAKVLNIKNVGRNTLFEVLREKQILMNSNHPYQKYIDIGYFRTIEQKYQKSDGSTHINIKTVVYQKRLDFIRKLFK